MVVVSLSLLVSFPGHEGGERTAFSPPSFPGREGGERTAFSPPSFPGCEGGKKAAFFPPMWPGNKAISLHVDVSFPDLLFFFGGSGNDVILQT